jgi:hypothetical protein
VKTRPFGRRVTASKAKQPSLSEMIRFGLTMAGATGVLLDATAFGPKAGLLRFARNDSRRLVKLIHIYRFIV